VRRQLRKAKRDPFLLSSRRPDAAQAWAVSEPLHKACARNAIDSSGKAEPDREQQVENELSALERQAADALRRARRLPVGAARNDLRQLAMGLVWLHRNGMDALMKQRPMSQLPADDAESASR
jgi:hypothetical protein